MIFKIIENKKSSSKQMWTSRDYHVQHNKYVDHQNMKIYCATIVFPELHYLGPHNNINGVRG